MNLYDKKTRRIVSILILVLIVAMTGKSVSDRVEAVCGKTIS